MQNPFCRSSPDETASAPARQGKCPLGSRFWSLLPSALNELFLRRSSCNRCCRAGQHAVRPAASSLPWSSSRSTCTHGCCALAPLLCVCPSGSPNAPPRCGRRWLRLTGPQLAHYANVRRSIRHLASPISPASGCHCCRAPPGTSSGTSACPDLHLAPTWHGILDHAYSARNRPNVDQLVWTRIVLLSSRGHYRHPRHALLSLLHRSPTAPMTPSSFAVALGANRSKLTLASSIQEDCLHRRLCHACGLVRRRPTCTLQGRCAEHAASPHCSARSRG
mmetsp:Transcript_102982/g.276698  ORF Transcript_102982/g.276698 Transcript_102982/m.276698 type:complete len:277 (-) Transcript_102982:198-1028(-)